MTLCLIPLLLLLWLNTFETKSEDRELLLKLVFQITLDFLDGIEMALCFKFKRDASIFIAKNGILIIGFWRFFSVVTKS